MLFCHWKNTKSSLVAAEDSSAGPNWTRHSPVVEKEGIKIDNTSLSDIESSIFLSCRLKETSTIWIKSIMIPFARWEMREVVRIWRAGYKWFNDTGATSFLKMWQIDGGSSLRHNTSPVRFLNLGQLPSPWPSLIDQLQSSRQAKQGRGEKKSAFTFRVPAAVAKFVPYNRGYFVSPCGAAPA